MYEAEKAPYVAKAEKRKEEYTKKMQAYNKRSAEGANAADEDESDKSKSEVNNEEEDDDAESGEERNCGDNDANACSSFGEHDFSKANPAPATTPEYVSTQQSGRSSTSNLKRKASLISVMEDCYKTMAASIDKLSMAMVDFGEKVAGSKFDVSHNCQTYNALDSLDLDENYRVRCYCYLCAHPSKAAIIVAAPTTIRARLLADIMKAAGNAQCVMFVAQ